MHAPWSIMGCPSNIFYQTTCTSMGPGSQGIILQEYHGSMWGKGLWKWLEAKTSSGRSNNATSKCARTFRRCTRSRSNKQVR
jgi:hypothetical protein